MHRLKTLIDRTYSRYMELKNKEFYFLLLQEAVTRKQALERDY
jgi:hypothetical protein